MKILNMFTILNKYTVLSTTERQNFHVKRLTHNMKCTDIGSVTQVIFIIITSDNPTLIIWIMSNAWGIDRWDITTQKSKHH